MEHLRIAYCEMNIAGNAQRFLSFVFGLVFTVVAAAWIFFPIVMSGTCK